MEVLKSLMVPPGNEFKKVASNVQSGAVEAQIQFNSIQTSQSRNCLNMTDGCGFQHKPHTDARFERSEFCSDSGS
jgi:hypothetical protein